MIYSIVPFNQMFYSTEDNKQDRLEVTINGENVVLLKNDNDTYSIERLISTNPKAYLNPDLMPGTLIMTITAKKEGPKLTWEIINKNLEQMET